MSVVAVAICDWVLVSVFANCSHPLRLRSVSGVIGSVGLQPFCWRVQGVTLRLRDGL
jgi:hypothetical protein